MFMLVTLLSTIISTFDLALTAEGQAAGVVYYIAPNGNDSVSCASATNINAPRHTLPAGASCLQPGDTLYVRGGTYTPSGQQNIDVTCTAAQPCVIERYPGDSRPVFRNIGMTEAHVGMYAIVGDNTDAYLTIRGTDFDGINDVVNNAGMWIQRHHVTLDDVTISNAARNAVYVANLEPDVGAADYTTIRNSRLLNCGRLQDDNDPWDSKGAGVYTSSGYGLYENNVIDGCRGSGFEINYGGNRYSIYRNNILRNLGASSPWGPEPNGQMTFGRGFALGLRFPGGNLGPDHIQIYNNILYNIHGAQGGEAYCINFTGSTNSLYANNTCYSADRPYFVLSGTDTTGITFQNNIFAGMDDPEPVQYTGTVTGTISNNLFNPSINTTFVNAPGGDFHLKSGSPAVDAGATVAAVTTDYEGTARRQGEAENAYDIGAYEWRASVPRPPTNLRVVGGS